MDTVVDVQDHGFNIWTTLTVKDDLIAVSENMKLQGKNKHSGKQWTRFSRKKSVFVSWRGARMRVYRRDAQGRMRDTTSYALNLWALSHYRDIERQRLEEGMALLGKGTLREVAEWEYPLVSDVIPIDGVTPGLVHTDMRGLTGALYGTKMVRKDLVRAVGSAVSLDRSETVSKALLLSRAIAGTVPTDWLASWLPEAAANRANGHAMRMLRSSDVRVVRKLFRGMTENQRRRLLRGGTDVVGIHDSVYMYRDLVASDPGYSLADKDFRTFRELHDTLAVDESQIGVVVADIEWDARARALEGTYGSGLQIVLPSDTGVLSEWSGTMHNCISSYSSHALGGQSLLYGVLGSDGSLVANMELDPRKGDIRQLLGRFNQSVDADVASVVKSAVQSVWPKAKVEGGWQ